MKEGLLIAKGKNSVYLLPGMANRHGLVAGATGTGKTVSLQSMAERFSSIGVPVFMADVKGDLSGISQTGKENPKVADRLKLLGITDHVFSAYPVMFWDVFGEKGHPVRTTVSEMGPLLFSRMLNLNDTQTGVLNAVFKIADDQKLLLLDLKDLRSMLDYVGSNASTFKTSYGNISTASIGAIQRGLLELETQGGQKFFGEPALDLDDFLQVDPKGRGMINILAADKLMLSPKIYATFLLWLLAELYERMPEVGDLEQPKLVFFFDEAHLLFTDAPKALLEKIEQIVRLVRSKGVGVYFVTQNPMDVPDTVLAQLGNRVQHALRAFTPNDQKGIRQAAKTFRANPDLDVEKTLTDLAVGEALVSFLDEKGAPSVVERVFIFPPQSQIGICTADERTRVIQQSLVYGHYEKLADRESAHELLKNRADQAQVAASQSVTPATVTTATTATAQRVSKPVKSQGQDMMEAMAKSAARAIGSQVGRQIIRGVLGSFLGGSSRRRY